MHSAKLWFGNGVGACKELLAFLILIGSEFRIAMERGSENLALDVAAAATICGEGPVLTVSGRVLGSSCATCLYLETGVQANEA